MANWQHRIFGLGACILAFATMGAEMTRGTNVAAEPVATDVHATDPRPGYAGDAACTSCHEKESASYAHTSHRNASQVAGPLSVAGDFNPPANVLTIVGKDGDRSAGYHLPELSFSMERKENEFFETAVTGWERDRYRRSESIDLVTGSGARGQTYLYWQGDRLFELPVSYWTEGRRWINSPGYVDGTADFARPVNPGCLECHASYIRATSSEATTNSYVKDTLVAGIGCETCHGAGAGHVAKYRAVSAGKANGEGAGADLTGGTDLLNPAHFTRDLQIDSCAVCHSGTARTALQPAYTFVPGKPLSDYFAPIKGEAADHPDVHGNQVGLLERSQCFQKSRTMSCSTCHDVHAAEKVAAAYSEKCLGCHTWQSCGVAKTRGIAIRKNCIDCHMPVESTNLIVSDTAGKEVRARMRNHWIKVYPSAKSEDHGRGPAQRAGDVIPRQ